MYLIIFLVLIFVIYKTLSGNASMNLFADKSNQQVCPPGLYLNQTFHMCADDPADVDLYDLCPPGKAPVHGVCKCVPLSTHPDCVSKKNQG